MDFQPFTKDKREEVCHALSVYDKVEFKVTAKNGWTDKEVIHRRLYESLNRRGELERYTVTMPNPGQGDWPLQLGLTSGSLWHRITYWAENCETEYRILKDDEQSEYP